MNWILKLLSYHQRLPAPPSVHAPQSSGSAVQSVPASPHHSTTSTHDYPTEPAQTGRWYLLPIMMGDRGSHRGDKVLFMCIVINPFDSVSVGTYSPVMNTPFCNQKWDYWVSDQQHQMTTIKWTTIENYHQDIKQPKHQNTECSMSSCVWTSSKYANVTEQCCSTSGANKSNRDAKTQEHLHTMHATLLIMSAKIRIDFTDVR